MYTHGAIRQVRRMGAELALARHLDVQLMVGQGLGGLAWGLLFWAVKPIDAWTAPDLFTVILLVVSSPFSLITTSHLWRGTLAFNGALWGLGLWRVATEARPPQEQFLVMIALGVYVAIVLSYGWQLHRQTLAGVMADLRSRQLGNELVTANAQLQEALTHAMEHAARDPLTQTLNRRAFLERASQEAAAMKREGRSACVLMLDLDYFKAVNDEHGHAMGDRVLMYASTCVQAQLREVDVLSRWGGEEFIILLPRTDLDGGLQVAERIRAWMAQPLDATWPPRLRVSATLGVARWRPDQDVMMAIGLADQALYAGKAAGRNRVQTVDAPAAP